MKVTISIIMNFLIHNLEKARKTKYVQKPYSWALYQTWKQIDKIEKEKEV